MQTQTTPQKLFMRNCKVQSVHQHWQCPGFGSKSLPETGKGYWSRLLCSRFPECQVRWSHSNACPVFPRFLGYEIDGRNLRRQNSKPQSAHRCCHGQFWIVPTSGHFLPNVSRTLSASNARCRTCEIGFYHWGQNHEIIFESAPPLWSMAPQSLESAHAA